MSKREYTVTGIGLLAVFWCLGLVTLGVLAKLNWYLLRLGWSLV